MLSNELHIEWIGGARRMWPILLAVMGVGSLLRASETGEYGFGVWFLFLSGIFFMHTFGVLSLRASWPLFIVAFGVSLFFPKSSRPGCAGAAGKGLSERRP
jgi:LiaF transmembrane domain